MEQAGYLVAAESISTRDRRKSLSSERAAEGVVLIIVDADTAVFCNPLYAGEEGLHGNHAYLHSHLDYEKVRNGGMDNEADC